MEKVIIYGSSVQSELPLELHKQSVEKKKLILRASSFEKPIDISWLKAASKKYMISDDIRDYIVVPVPVITSGIPNRRMQGFSINDLLEFDTEQKRQRYATFVGCPTFREHKNSDLTQAKGINLDATLTYVPKYNLFKVNVLSAFDRSKCSELADRILTNKSNNFSMGAVCTTFKCSICGHYLGPGVERTCTCYDTDYTNLRSYGEIVGGRLHYLLAVDPVFIENSYVEDPADITAIGEPI